MLKKYLGTIVAVYLLSNFAYGQSLQDTVINLDEIQIVAKKDKYLVGSKIEKIDSLKLQSASGESLAGVINNFLPIYVKQDAGGLATIRFRGTSPDHTAIMFNGININSLTLGHTNISSVPTFLFNDIKVQFGSSSSLYGSDAIGGSIQLGSSPNWNRGLSLAIQQDLGSFQSYFSGLKVSYSNSKFSYSIKGYREEKKNDFPFLNTAVRDFDKSEYIKDTSKNTAKANYGFLQEMAFRFSDKFQTFLNVWYEDNWHQIQPNMSANYYGGSFSEIQNNHLRLVSGFKYYLGKHKLTADFGYVYDYQIYNKIDNEIISTNRVITNVNYFNKDFFKGDFNIGLNYLYIKPDVYAYDKNLKEDRIEAFLAYKRTFFKKLTASLNLRETIVLDYESQFTPSIGLNYTLLNSAEQVLDSKFSVSRSYKIPTFNDRFWQVDGELVGNPDLLPENGINYELGTKYELKNKSNGLKLGLTGFYMNVDQWIQWVPKGDGNWYPDNKDKVHSKGVELTVETLHKISKIELNSGVSYSFNKVILVKDYSNPNSSSIGKQLAYSPEHMGRVFLSADYKKWYLIVSSSYTGQRFNEKYEILEDYFLLNASIGKSIRLKKHKFVFNFKTNNILNNAYQNQKLYAMPGRNYLISIKYSLNK